MAERGDTSARAAEAAALDTRRAKDYGVSAERLQAEWHARAAELGFGRREIEACLYRAFEPEREPPDAERLLDELASPSGLTRNDSSFSRREVIRTLAERSGSGGPARSASWPIASSPQSGSCSWPLSAICPRPATPRPSYWRSSASCWRARSSARQRVPGWWTS